MTPHHRLIVKILKKHKVISSTDFYVFYRSEARKRGLNPKSRRTFSNYVDELIELGYIEAERAKVRGNVRLFKYV